MKIAIVTILTLLGNIEGRIAPKLFSDERIALINSQATTWVAGRNFPEDTILEDIKKLLGAKTSKNQLEAKLTEGIQIGSIPESFDARQKWANCTSVSLIRDQSKCGSCWAVAVASMISDRICIHSNGQKQTQISALDIMSCCENCGNGCHGGYPSLALTQWRFIGVVSGGEYGTKNGCKPYPFPKCRHRSNSTKYPECPAERYSTPKCEKKCSNEEINYMEDLNKAESIYSLHGVADIQNDILKNGPVEVHLDVYDDFLNYKSGVYQKTSGAKYVGGHALRMIGWGIENNIPYWLVANSWNEQWGENGTFKILRGNNECLIEKTVLGGIPEK